MGRRLLIGLLVALGLAGCAVTPGGEGLAGRMVGVDDTGLPDRPLGGGAILAVPAARAPDLWAAADLPGAPDDLAHLGTRVPRKAVAGIEGAFAAITDSGRFRLDAPAGPAVVCYADGTASDTLRLWGCTELDLPPDGDLRGSWGEGGFHIEVA